MNKWIKVKSEVTESSLNLISHDSEDTKIEAMCFHFLELVEILPDPFWTRCSEDMNALIKQIWGKKKVLKPF